MVSPAAVVCKRRLHPRRSFPRDAGAGFSRSVATAFIVFQLRVVTGTPNERWGEQVTAVVALRPGASPSEDELRETAAKELARFKLPKAFVFVDSILRSASGKPDYRWAKQTAAAAVSRGADAR